MQAIEGPVVYCTYTQHHSMSVPKLQTLAPNWHVHARLQEESWSLSVSKRRRGGSLLKAVLVQKCESYINFCCCNSIKNDVRFRYWAWGESLGAVALARSGNIFRATCVGHATLMHTLRLLPCRKRGCQTLMLLPSTKLRRKLSTVSFLFLSLSSTGGHVSPNFAIGQ